MGIKNSINNKLGTPTSGNLANCTFPTLNQNTTGTANIAGGTAGAIPYQSGADATTVLAATATASKMLLSGSSAAPTWSTSTIPSSAGATANKVLLSDGTNYVLSTPTFPNASATSGKIIKSDGTNWIASTETYAAPSTSGNMLMSDGTNWVSQQTRNNWTSLVISGSNYTNATTSLTDVFVSGTLSTATLYEFEANLYVNSSSTAGMQVAIQQTGTGTGALGVWSGTATNAAATGLAIGSNALGTSGAACVLVNGDGSIYMRGFIKTGSSGSPTIKIQALKVTSGTATVYIGSVMRFRVAN